eukprot:TRINITY_DN1151_c0_g1_i1.p1 TRINITY_DN1151_c0_g1~~TRINITY_DN1151_c0_g1_i1.p1  ORF type:complete len:382 (-),score=98.27 TRINITY_DN1151_c0_g1_i1:9-1154(-)
MKLTKISTVISPNQFGRIISLQHQNLKKKKNKKKPDDINISEPNLRKKGSDEKISNLQKSAILSDPSLSTSSIVITKKLDFEVFEMFILKYEQVLDNKKKSKSIKQIAKIAFETQQKILEKKKILNELERKKRLYSHFMQELKKKNQIERNKLEIKKKQYLENMDKLKIKFTEMEKINNYISESNCLYKTNISVMEYELPSIYMQIEFHQQCLIYRLQNFIYNFTVSENYKQIQLNDQILILQKPQRIVFANFIGACSHIIFLLSKWKEFPLPKKLIHQSSGFTLRSQLVAVEKTKGKNNKISLNLNENKFLLFDFKPGSSLKVLKTLKFNLEVIIKSQATGKIERFASQNLEFLLFMKHLLELFNEPSKIMQYQDSNIRH